MPTYKNIEYMEFIDRCDMVKGNEGMRGINKGISCDLYFF